MLERPVRETEWERDQEAWNLPRAPLERVARRANDEHEAGARATGEQEAEDPAMAPARAD